MKEIKIKETYLLFLIVIGLVSLSLYSTYALFTASTEITDVVSFSTSLTTDSSILEYEMITVPVGESKIIELNVINSHTSTIYYGAWYQALTDASNINIGVYTQENSTPASGTIDAGSSITVLVGVTNNGEDDVVLNVGVVGSETSNLNLSSNRTLITGEWASEVYVTQEYLDNHVVTAGETINLTYTTPEMTQVSLNPGEYKLEVWGAQGGSFNTTYIGGKGGYSSGTLTLTETTTLYVYPGGKGTDGTTSGTFAGGFNGGGQAYTSSATYDMSAGGGGSDIRIGTDSLYARVIVAGGGGGAGSYSSSYRYSGGVGGGKNGLAGGNYNTTYPAGGAGSQTTYGTSYYNSSNVDSTTYGTPASFGTGGAAGSSGYVAGGGGGWYGGGYARRASGGGGSGYVYTSETASNYPSGCLLNSSYYLSDTSMYDGDDIFNGLDGAIEIGHSGDGAVRISGTKYGTYSIPALFGLSDLNIEFGEQVDLTANLYLKCENGGTGCSLAGTDITDTSTLSVGTHTIYYTVYGVSNQKYIYSRTINITLPASLATLTNLGLSLNKDTPDFANSSCSSGCNEATVGIYGAEDDLGTSYYFRGDVTNNYVTFAGFYWRIIRINGDGSIRMIYDGTSAHANGESSTDRQVTTSEFNVNCDDNTYLGYMYGTAGSSSYATTHSNTTDSTIKGVVDSWYKTNIVDTGYSTSVVDAIYCNDREVSTADSDYTGDGTGTSTTAYKPHERSDSFIGITPVLTCTQKNDRFTTEPSIGSVSGNDKLTYPVGLITADEVLLAGGTIWSSGNSKYYLYSGQYYWTMSPSILNSDGFPLAYRVYSDGYTDHRIVEYVSGVRPVISLSSDALIYGTGTATDPFRLTSAI